MGGGGRGRHVKLRVTRTGDPDATDSRRKAVQELIGKRGGKNSTFVLEAGGEGGDLGDQWGEDGDEGAHQLALDLGLGSAGEAVGRGAQPRRKADTHFSCISGFRMNEFLSNITQSG